MKERRQKKGSPQNGFIIALLCSVALAFLFPSPGARGGWMHPDLLNNAGIALILFLQGLAMAVERMKSGAVNWRLHLIIQSWEHYGIGLTVKVLIGVVALFTTVSLFVWAASNVAGLERDDFIAALFCSVKKTLAMGVPLAQLIFGAKGNLGLIVLPIMFYHPFQLLFADSWLITFPPETPASQ
jgi:predicted Na+-dependent transporter